MTKRLPSRFGIAVAFCLFSFMASSFAAEWTVDDILLMERASSVELSRDGSMAVWTQSKMNPKKGSSVSQVYLRYRADDYLVQLTRGEDSSSSPHFSPNGKKLAFLSNRKASGGESEGASGGSGGDNGPKSQVWILDLRGGEPQAATSMPQGVNSFRWLDDDTLLLVAQEDPTNKAQEIKKAKDSSRLVDDPDEAPIRLFRFAIKGKKTERLTQNADRISRLDVSWDGRWAVTTHNRSSRYVFDNLIQPIAFLHDLKEGKSEQLFPGTRIMARGIRFTADNSGFYFTAPYSSHPIYNSGSINKLYYFNLASKTHEEIDLDWEHGVGSGFTLAGSELIVSLAGGARDNTARFTRSGSSFARQPVSGDHASNIYGLEGAMQGNTVAYEFSTASKPSQWYTATLNGAALTGVKRLTNLNSGLDKKTISKTEVVRWTGALDETVDGILYYPYNYETGKKYPLMVMIHGGPSGVDQDDWGESWSYPHQLYTQRGAFILKPNYHGSSNYGLKFVESISGGKYNDLEWIDVEKGVDSLIAKGLVDPDRMGIMGWSNGSIISIEISTRTTRYKAVGAGAGDVNWTSDWGNAMFGHAFEDYYLGATPMQNPQLYIDKSPLFRMDKVKTPTIIFFGTEDVNVPTEQGWQHYRALQHLGNTDTKFFLFPGEPHGLRKYVHQKRKVEEELAWFDKYLFGKADSTPAWMKPESPLSGVVYRTKIGETPDMAKLGDLMAGRFEVTRSQFAAFKPGYKYAPGTEAFPATGVSFEDAKGYVAWLSQRSGKKYRLPGEKEMASHLKASKAENTLDRWTSYDVNPDDAAALATTINSLEPDHLLMPVGSFTGKGKDPVFDLGGNAAEWVVAEDGTGKLLGGSVDTPADAKLGWNPRRQFAGFRVILDPAP